MIRVSKLIKELQEFEKKHGNVPVLMREDGYGGHAMHYISGVENHPTKIYPHSFEDIDKDDPKVKALFPKWDGDPESLWNSEMEPIKCLEIGAGDILYAT